MPPPTIDARDAKRPDALAVGKPDGPPTDWLYAEGYAAGVRWTNTTASYHDLDYLETAANHPALSAPPWLRGWIDGALATFRAMPAALPADADDEPAA